jgi:predicted nuclease of predicted toxin-antitoxin system
MLGPVWIDAQLPPSLAARLRSDLGVDAVHVFDLGLHTASDRSIFDAARDAAGVVITKYVDFVQLLDRHGPPPCVVWITIGNAPTAAVWQALRRG